MKKRRKIQYSLMVLMLFFLLMTTRATGSIGAMDEIWNNMVFNKDQSFTYDLQRGGETIGEITISVTDSKDNIIRLIVEGNYYEETFNASTLLFEEEKFEEFFDNFMTIISEESPYEVKEILCYTIFFSPYTGIPVYGGELFSIQDSQITDEQGVPYLLQNLNNKQEYAGYEGSLVHIKSQERFNYTLTQVGDDDEIDLNIEMCISPDLLLPLKAVTEIALESEKNFYAAELTNYTNESEFTVREKDSAFAENKLIEVEEYFRASDLNIGERLLKHHEIVGAAAGFGIKIEGKEVELYYYNLETADAGTIKSFEEARETGMFCPPETNMEMPVIIRGNIMLMGLEYGDFYTHPAKDEIIELFNNFKVD
ncbi:MAG: hypothetical protein ACOCQN_00740 [Halanaerobiaceae bacterium]